jgi:hypothetical protein
MGGDRSRFSKWWDWWLSHPASSLAWCNAVKPFCLGGTVTFPAGVLIESAFNQVIASYHRARETGLLFDTFYELFLVKSPDIPPMFAGTHFAHQKLMLRESILELLVFAQTGHGEA